LPFFDDFAYYSKYPNQEIWADKKAYINRNFPINPVTVGVATLEPFNEEGYLYDGAGSSVFEADELTSRAINLKNFIRKVGSNELYSKSGETYNLIQDAYMYDSINEKFISIIQDAQWYTASTPLYKYDLANDTFVDYKDKIYFFNALSGEFEYIKGSEVRSDSIEEYTVDNSIVLSFFVEKKGLMDEPEKGDSLVLQFNTPYDTTGIFINEVYNDYIEIYNATFTDLNITKYAVGPKLPDSVLTTDTLKTYALTPMTKKYAGQFDFVSGKNDTIAKLWVNNDTLILYFIETAEIIDSIYYTSSTKKDVSIGRERDGSNKIVIQSDNTLNKPNSEWQTVWSNDGDSIPTDSFVQRFIPIKSIKYLSYAFRFRFKSYASLSTDKSAARVEDFWHLDYIYLNANQTDDNIFIPDVAFTSTMEPFYKDYYSIPLSHAQRLDRDDFSNEFEIRLHNFSTSTRTVKKNFKVTNNFTNFIKDIYIINLTSKGNSSISDNILLTGNEDNNQNIYFFDLLEDDFDRDSSSITYSSYFTDATSTIYYPFRWNDTISFTQNFYNYYAYDDGTAEAGYGLRGGEMLRAAYKFKMLQEDTLRAIKIYFNETLSGSIYFNLCVWADDPESHTPGELLYIDYSKINKGTKDEDGFITYYITDKALEDNNLKQLIVDKTFYVGWQQPKDLSLNVGVDLNTKRSGLVYQNFSFDWEPSLLSNPLMIRAVVGTELKNPQTKKETYKPATLKISPNPAKNTIYLNKEYQSISILNTTGSTIITDKGQSLDVSKLPPGVYTLKAIDENSMLSIGRFIKL